MCYGNDLSNNIENIFRWIESTYIFPFSLVPFLFMSSIAAACSASTGIFNLV